MIVRLREEAKARGVTLEDHILALLADADARTTKKTRAKKG